MTKTKLPMPIEVLEEIIHEIAQNTANVRFTDHCRERLDQRGITLIEAIRCLRRGCITRYPEYNAQKAAWEFRMSEKPPRDVVCLVGAITLDPLTHKIIAITVWEV
ncbi:hypothetical protein M2318_001269 [Metapseudomonas resinovorans]|uniref:DUF4258 domain-containing protein n=1 Tax=Metapseudomonas resinovorans TaxID=53412 RepID=UPI003D1AAEF8